jgi:chitinase
MYWDDLAKAAWLYNGEDQIFWTYDEPNALALKAQYIKYHDLGGIMFWEISGDNDQGVLLSTLYEGLQPEAPAADPCSDNWPFQSHW